MFVGITTTDGMKSLFKLWRNNGYHYVLLCKEQIMTFNTYRNVIKFTLHILRCLVPNGAIYLGKIRAQPVLFLHLTFCKLYIFKY